VKLVLQLYLASFFFTIILELRLSSFLAIKGAPVTNSHHRPLSRCNFHLVFYFHDLISLLMLLYFCLEEIVRLINSNMENKIYCRVYNHRKQSC
jgi:hypothetical protein